MAFTAPGSQGLAGWVWAGVAAAFHTGMLPMSTAFALAGVALFLLSTAVTREPRDGASARPGYAGRAPLRRMCMGCKAIPQAGPGGREVWLPLEQSLLQTDNLLFRHGLCPRCKDTFLAEVAEQRVHQRP
jgi:hypothetical protein